MWQKSYYTVTSEVTKEQIWNVLTDINQWIQWDTDIDHIELKGEPGLNANFYLKPKGGPKTRLTILQYDKPNIFEDMAHLPLAKMYTKHTMSETNEGLKIMVEIKVTGLLGFLWSKVIAQKQIDTGLSQTQKLIERAKIL